jgi:two-component system response regulator HydG
MTDGEHDLQARTFVPASRASPRGAVTTEKIVLLVDDDRQQVNALAEVLRSKGLTVDYAVSGREAIARLAERLPDFLIVDARLPDYDGTDVINHAHALKPELPTALLTGYPRDHPPIARTLAMTRSAYLGKPVDVHALFELVESAIG